MSSECMLAQAELDKVLQRFKARGLASVMTTLPKTVRFPRISSTRLSPRHRGDRSEMEPHWEVPVKLTPSYLNLRVSGAPDIQLAKNKKYPILLPPMSKDVLEEGALLGYIQNLKYQDYNL